MPTRKAIVSKLIFWVIAIVAIGDTIALAQQTQTNQHYWEVSPNFGDIWKLPQPNRAPPINVQSLVSRQTQDRIQTAQLICVNHDKENFDQGPKALALLLDRLSQGNEPIIVQRSMMSAACAIDDGSESELLWKLSQSDVQLQATVEKALVRWKSPIAIATWRARLKDPDAHASQVAVALEGLAVIGGEQDRALLLDVLHRDSTSLSNRLLAAEALGSLMKSGLNDVAQKVLDSKMENRFVLAAHLIRNHNDEKTKDQLQSILECDSEPAQFIAANALANNFPSVAVLHGPKLVLHHDSNIRRLALQILKSTSDIPNLRLQAKLMDDSLRDIRRSVGDRMIAAASNGQREVVDEIVSEYLNSQLWTGVEQAIIVAVQLGDRSRCSRLVELLKHPREEVNMLAGWGLMELAQDGPILDQIFSHCETVTSRLISKDPLLAPSDAVRLSYLFEALGRNRYKPAHELMTKFIPKNFAMGNISRASAIWALGQINRDKDTSELRKQLQSRVEDATSMIPENYVVRFTSILALGELGHADSRESIVKFGGDPPSQLGYASQWALKQFAERSQ